ncbi:MAG: Hint domain-containing protein [Proteobacteria bacterium]|nr:Hint domain-containing protein [Pseudomonadota bacterium]
MPTLKKDGSQQVPDQFEGSTVIIITVQDYPSPGDTTRLSFMPDEEATQAEMDAFGNGAISVQNVNTTPPDIPVCFVKGTLITTPSGQIPVEDLRAGDLVKTRGQGDQPVRWVGSQKFLAHGKYAPIRIRAGALGNTRDLLVSPQHRMLLTGWRLELLFDHTEVLVTAKSLLNDQSITREDGGEVEYYHILLDNHQIIFAEGCPSESFHPGGQAMTSFSKATQQEIYELFPALKGDIGNYGKTARISLKSHETAIALRALQQQPAYRPIDR